MRATLLGVIGLICVATMAQAQLTGLGHLWTVPGVMNTTSGIGTFIACSNVSTASETIGVEFYGSSGTYIPPGGGGVDSVTVAPGATVLFGVSTAPGLSVDVNYFLSTLTKGRAHILASTSRGILCSAFLADTNNPVPQSMVTLTIAKKTKQKGD